PQFFGQPPTLPPPAPPSDGDVAPPAPDCAAPAPEPPVAPGPVPPPAGAPAPFSSSPPPQPSARRSAAQKKARAMSGTIDSQGAALGKSFQPATRRRAPRTLLARHRTRSTRPCASTFSGAGRQKSSISSAPSS